MFFIAKLIIYNFWSFAQKNCTEKSCYMHLDYEFDTEKQVWGSAMVGHQHLKLVIKKKTPTPVVNIDIAQLETKNVGSKNC